MDEHGKMLALTQGCVSSHSSQAPGCCGRSTWPPASSSRSTTQTTTSCDMMATAGHASRIAEHDINADPDLWFEDGSVVVVAHNTGFRVHKHLLSHLSSVFRDVFAVPQPPTAGTSDNGPTVFQGLPVVHVSDSIFDMKCMLCAIYDGRKYLNNMSPNIPFPVLSALMRLGHKYELADILDDAARHLEKFFTTDFRSWLEYCSGDEDATFDFSEEKDADLLETVNLARLTRKHSILPLALYKCCQLDLTEIMHGIQRSNGSVIRLDQEDIERCIHGREALLRESCKMANILARPKRDFRCSTPSLCSQQLKPLIETFTQMLPKLVTTDALSGLRTQAEDLMTFPCWENLCHHCRDGLVSQHQLKQRDTWGELLKILDLTDGDLRIEWAKPGPSWIIEMA